MKAANGALVLGRGAGGEGARDQAGVPSPTIGRDLRERERREPARRHQPVQRGGEVGQAVDQRAVEIEHQGRRHIRCTPQSSLTAQAV